MTGEPQKIRARVWVLILALIAFNVWYDFRDPLNHPLGILIDAAFVIGIVVVWLRGTPQ